MTMVGDDIYMVEFTIKDIIQKLLGNIEPIGDTYYDDIRYQNLEEVGELYYWLTEQMVLVATHSRKDLYSVSRNAELAGRYCDYALDLLSSVKDEDHHTVYAKWSYVNKREYVYRVIVPTVAVEHILKQVISAVRQLQKIFYLTSALTVVQECLRMVIQMDELCPMCKKHEATVKTERAKTIIKGIEVEYNETVYFCSYLGEGDEDAYFIPPKVMNENIRRARESYKARMDGDTE